VLELLQGYTIPAVVAAVPKIQELLAAGMDRKENLH
jgi:uncharacterized protein YoaH (UPF0181 family)